MIKKRQLQRCCSSYVNILFILTINQLEWLPDVSVYENLSPNIVHYDGKKREKQKNKKTFTNEEQSENEEESDEFIDLLSQLKVVTVNRWTCVIGWLL